MRLTNCTDNSPDAVAVFLNLWKFKLLRVWKSTVAMTIQKRVCPVCFSYLTPLYIQDILYYTECLAVLREENVTFPVVIYFFATFSTFQDI